MMKAFSFLTILESLSKKLSILRTKMHSDDLRVNYESITSQLRVSRPFSRTSFALSRRASFALSRRASHFAAILTILFTIGVGNMWGEEVLVDIDFTSLTAQEVTQSGLYYDNRIYFDVKSDKKIIVSNSGINFNSQNGSAGTGGHKIGFLLKGVNKQFTVEITHGYSGKSFKFKAGYSKGAEYTKQSNPWSDCFSKVNTQTFSGLDGTDYVFWIGEASSSYTTIKSIRITTPSSAGSVAVTSVSLNKTTTTLEIGGTETLTATIEPDNATNKNVTWSSSNTSVATVDENGVVTAVAAGTANITVTTEDGNKTATCAVTVNAAGGGGDGDSDGCTKIFWFANDADATAAGVENNTTTFSGVNSGNNSASGSITIDGKSYSVTGRGSTNKTSITFSVPANKVGTLYGLAITSSSSGTARTLTLTNTASYSKTQSTSTSQSVAGEFTFTDMPAGSYTLAWDGNGAECMLCLKLCDAETPTYSVTYDDNDATSGSVPTDDDDYESGATVTVKGNTGSLAKTGYTFGGWNTKDDGTGINYTAGTGTFTISANTTLYAKWNVNSYTLTWNLDGGSITTAGTAAGQVAYGTAITAPTVTKTGYTFNSWNPSVASTMPAANTTYTAQWTANQYNITYKDQGNADFSGTHGANHPTKHTYGTATTLVEPTKANYAFGGWYTNAECTSSPVTSLGATAYTANITLYAKWNCTAPTNVAISGAWDKFGGETISLTATPTGGTGDYSYQWQKYYDSNWNNITDNATATTANLVYENCDGSHSGTYRCVVSTGTDCSTASDGLQVKVYTLECYTNGTNIYHFHRNGNTQSGTLTLDLNANTAYKFKVHVDNDYYGNGGTINKDETNWVLGAELGTPDLTVNSGLGGTFTFTIDYSTNGNNTTLGVPKISVTYPRKTIYLVPNSDWLSNSAKFAFYYYGTSGTGWTDFLTSNDCGMSAEIPQWNGLNVIAVRFNPSDATPGWNGDGHVWNQTADIAATADKNCVTITDWNAGTYGTYSTPTYTITFNANGGTGSMANVIGITCSGSATLTQNAFTRTGYTFAGWATTADGDVAHADKATISNITSNITLYAKWTPNANTAYTVKHYKQQLDGTYSDTPDETQNLTGTTAASVTPEVKSYEGFTAPSTQTVTIAADGSTVVNYQYTRNSYKVTWKPAGGNWNDDTNDKVVEHKYGAEIQAPEKPSRTGYEFVEWNPTYIAGTTMPAEDLTYTAQWREIAQTYTITYNLGPENWKGENPLPTYTAGTEHTLPTIDNLTNYNYGTFQGWCERADFQGNAVTSIPANATGDKTYYAKWVYDIKFFEVVDEETDVVNKEFTNQLEGSYPTTYTYGIGITLPALPAKDGYTEDGWYSQWCVCNEQKGWDDACKFTALDNNAYGAVNFAVKYTANTYTITWDANGGNVTPESSTYTYDGSAVELPTPTRDGFTFNGWFTADTEGTKITEIGTTNKPTSDVTYYAQWTENTTPDPGECEILVNAEITSKNAASVTDGKWASDATAAASVQDKGNGTTGWKLGSDGNYFRISLTENTFKAGDVVTINIGTGGVSEQLVLYSDNGETEIGSKTEKIVQGANEITLTADSRVINLYRLNKSMNPWVISMSVKRCGVPHTVTLNTNEGTINAGNITSYIEGVGATLPTNVTKTGYTFGGWYESADFQGDAVTTISTTATGDKTYWAKWEERELGEGCFWANSQTLTSNSVTLADGTEVALEGCTRDADGISIGGNMLFTAPAGKYFETFSFDATCGKDDATNYYKINGVDRQSLENSTKAEQTYTITIPAATNASTIQIIKNGTTPKVSQICYTLKTTCTNPTITFNDGEYTVGGSALDLSTLFESNSNGTVTYTVTNANGTGATINGTSFTASAAGTATVKATQAANGDYCSGEATATITVTAASVDPDPEPSGDCITISYFETENYDCQNSKPDANAKYLYGYTQSDKTPEYAYTITTNKSNNVGKNSGAELYLYYGTSVNIYADNTTTGGTPQDFSGITYISIDVKMVKSGYYSSFDIKVGDEVIADDISLEGTAQSNYVTFAYNVSNLDGKVTIIANGSSTNHHIYVDNIKICTVALPSCTTPVLELEGLSAQKVCPGNNVSWTAIVNNTATLQENGETIAYQWNKKGNNTVLSNNATLTLDKVTEAAGGTYVVTATVSAEGKASKTASKEVTLTVTPATATPTITANTNTIFAGNPVTLKATCASSEVTYQWYTCNADGTNAQAIGGATNTTYTFTAGAAGTYYYKVIVTGNGTHSCGDAEKVYELVVKTPSAGCYDMIIFDSSKDQTIPAENATGTEANTGASWANVGTSTKSDPCTYTYNDKTYKKGWKFVSGSTSSNNRYIQFVIPEGYTGSLFLAAYSTSTNRTVFIDTKPTNTVNNTYASIHISTTGTLGTASAVLNPGTYYVCATDGLHLVELSIEICSDVNCTDPQVTATVNNVNNTTVCEGTENVTFTATNYADGTKTFQWQKKDGNTWTNINGATSATYTIPSVTTDHAGQYRVIAEKNCKRISEEVTLTVLTAPTFNTFADEASVMKGNALAISDVQATGATGYAWYKSSDNSLDAAEDTKVGTSKDLLLAAASIPEAADQTFYLFCVASNSCGSITSNAITVTVTPFVEEECATKGNEGDREFGFKNTSCGQDTYGDSKTPVWKTSSRSKYLTYTAPEGRYFATAKVTVAHSDKTKCGYAYSTDGGATWTFKELEGLSTTLTQKTIDLSELSETVNAFRISRNLQDGNEKDWGVTTGTFYLAEACFTYENACTETTLTAGSYNNEYNITDGGDFTEPTFTLTAGKNTLTDQTLTYTSSNTAIATVDEEGNVEFEGMTGTVIITATFAGGEINETEYCACQGSYTITVDCNDEAPEIVAADEKNLDGCNNSITLEAKMQNGTAFADGTFQWYRDGEAIEGATSASYEVVRAGTYTVSRTYTCTMMSSISAVVTNEKVEPEVERLTPFQYYHVDKTYSNQMKNRHLFAVTSYGTYEGKRYHLTATRNGETLNLSSSNAFFTIPSSDNAVDTVMIDLNELKGKYAEGDEIVITCAPINSCDLASAITSSITIHVIDQTPTLALICSGANGEGTRDTKTLVVGGDFLTGYNKADLCQQTGNKTFNPNIEWGFYTELKEKYIVTPVNGYAEFNKLNYEPFDILLLTDYPKASHSEAAATILDDMAALCDYRPLLSLKAHMVAKSPSKWAAKGFTTSPVVPDTTSQYANIVCYAHPMFDNLDDAQKEGIYHDHDDFNQLVYKILTGPGHEGNKGLQGFELKDADNFVTIGLVHYNATAEVVTHDNHTHLEWTPAADDRQLVAIAERQANIEARMILFAINCGAQSMQTPMGRQVLLTCLDYLLKTDLIEVADCRLTFDNGEGAQGDEKWENGEKPHDYEGTGYQGDGLWSTAANWGPDYNVVPGRNNDVRIAAPCTVDAVKTKVLVGDEEQFADAYFPEVLSIHITKDGSLTIPANSSLTARSTILRADEDGNVYPTNVEDISLGSNAGGNASLILNNERGDTKAGVAMYSKAKADTKNYSAAASTWQYIGTPHSDVQNAANNYYDSWLYQYDTGTQGWTVIQNGGPLVPFRGYCVTHPERGHTYWMEGTLAATTNQDIIIPAGKFVVVANSWTAPIQIHELTDDDMEGLAEETIYFFNTGSDPEGNNSVTQNAKGNARWAEGTYISVPIHAADYTGEDTNIPSMQGFYVVGGGADGTLHLDYERHVRAPRKNTPSGPMHAPARRVAADNEPQVAKFLFRGKRYDDRLIILERPDFTRGYDSGWDGEQWGGNAAAPMSYVVAETRWDAVSAIPEYEGTIIGFRAGEDSEYTIHFDYDGMEDALYLLDTDTQIYTRVLKGNSYTFTCADKAEHNRFILTRKAPQIATGTDHINTGENAKAVKFIKDDKIFIFVNGMLYDATGKIVIR